MSGATESTAAAREVAGGVPEPEEASADRKPQAGTGSVLPASEELIARFGDLTAHLLYSWSGDGGRVLAVTSALAGEGVTMSCVAAGIALARSTTRNVVLIDANLARPALHSPFGMPDAPGLLHIVSGYARAGRADPADASAAPVLVGPMRTSIPNLWLLPAGDRVGDATRLLTSDAATDAIRAVTAPFDYAIIDCPPVLSSVGTAALCRLASSVALVVRARVTPRDEVARACERLRGSSLMGVLLNGGRS